MPQKIERHLTTSDDPLPELASADELLALPSHPHHPHRGLAPELTDKRITPGSTRKASRTAVRITSMLERWCESQPVPRGEVHSGDVVFHLGRDVEPILGIDIAYISAQTAAANADDVGFIKGLPVLAVVILSPSDTCKKTWETITRFQQVGVQLTWLIDTVFQMVTVHSRGEDAELLNGAKFLDGGSHLPGFRVPVRELFQI